MTNNSRDEDFRISFTNVQIHNRVLHMDVAVTISARENRKEINSDGKVVIYYTIIDVSDRPNKEVLNAAFPAKSNDELISHLKAIAINKAEEIVGEAGKLWANLCTQAHLSPIVTQTQKRYKFRPTEPVEPRWLKRRDLETQVKEDARVGYELKNYISFKSAPQFSWNEKNVKFRMLTGWMNVENKRITLGDPLEMYSVIPNNPIIRVRMDSFLESIYNRTFKPFENKRMNVYFKVVLSYDSTAGAIGMTFVDIQLPTDYSDTLGAKLAYETKMQSFKYEVESVLESLEPDWNLKELNLEFKAEFPEVISESDSIEFQYKVDSDIKNHAYNQRGNPHYNIGALMQLNSDPSKFSAVCFKRR